MIKGLLFASVPIIVIFIGILLPNYPGASETFFFAKRDKDSLLKNTISPRIIFIGGSNLSMSLDSRMVSDSLHMNPINMGLDYNIGLMSMFQDVIGYIQKGDKIIISSEYEQFFGRMIYGGYPIPTIEFEVSPWNLSRLSFDQWFNLLKVIPGYALRRLQVWKYFLNNTQKMDSFYNRKSFNEFGDHIAHWDAKGRNPTFTQGYTGEFNSKSVQLIVDFQKNVIEKGANLYIVFPPYQESSFNINKKSIEMIQNALSSSGLNVLNVPERYVMNDTLMFDSPYHLTREGIEIRTRFLIQDMQKINAKPQGIY